MYDKDFRIPVLYDFYAEFLTDKQRDAIEFFYEEDMSLAEMSEHILVEDKDGNKRNISRQGARDSVKSAEKVLYELEEKLGLYKKYEETKKDVQLIKECAAQIRDINLRTIINSQINQNVDKIISAANNILK